MPTIPWFVMHQGGIVPGPLQQATLQVKPLHVRENQQKLTITTQIYGFPFVTLSPLSQISIIPFKPCPHVLQEILSI
jgi:hypothetical protein